jgi:Kelch motif
VAASLPDGQVLIAGGFNGSSYLQSAELFDLANDTFTALPASGDTQLQDPREIAVAASLPDGQVLIAGGFNSGIALQSAELFNSAPQAAVAGGDFGDQTLGQPSAVQPLVLTNVGAQALTVTGGALDAGGDAGDFTITADACAGRTLAFEQSCTITARFTPTTAGTRSATIGLSDNEPTASTIALSGTGVAPNSGPVGATGPQGNSGQIELITCRVVTKTVKEHGKKRTVTRHKCTTKLISGTATFTTTIARATLTRGGATFATGTAQLTRLILHDRRPLRPGLYTLTLTRPVGRLRFTTRQEIAIG